MRRTEPTPHDRRRQPSEKRLSAGHAGGCRDIGGDPAARGQHCAVCRLLDGDHRLRAGGHTGSATRAATGIDTEPERSASAPLAQQRARRAGGFARLACRAFGLVDAQDPERAAGARCSPAGPTRVEGAEGDQCSDRRLRLPQLDPGSARRRSRQSRPAATPCTGPRRFRQRAPGPESEVGYEALEVACTLLAVLVLTSHHSD